MNELNLSYGLKEDNMTMGHVMPLTAVAIRRSILSTGMMAQERGTLILGLGDKIPITIAEPVVKMEYAMVGLIVLAICLTAIPHGIWWDSYGAYASSLFLIYIIAFQSAALSVGWINDQQINTIDLKNSMKNDEIEGSVKAWLQELKTLLDAWSEDAPSHHIRVQNEAEKLWQIK